MEMRSSWSRKERGELLMTSQIKAVKNGGDLRGFRKYWYFSVTQGLAVGCEIKWLLFIIYGKTFCWIQLLWYLFYDGPTCEPVFRAAPESSLESQADVESAGQQSDYASLPSTSQDPGNFLLFTCCKFKTEQLNFQINSNYDYYHYQFICWIFSQTNIFTYKISENSK